MNIGKKDIKSLVTKLAIDPKTLKDFAENFTKAVENPNRLNQKDYTNEER